MSAFLARPIEGEWPYLWLDATYVKAREGGRVVTKACVLAVGVNAAGRREVLGLAVGPAETEKFWSAFLRDLVGRGLSGVQLAISDAHQGLKQAVGAGPRRELAALPGALHARCAAPMSSAATRSMVVAAIRTAFAQQGQARGARTQWPDTADSLRPRFAQASPR
ncbi:MAG: transposase [Halofilum sp. (in: g-proteobacteria)]|nr:transposase [Halofilum sp. (in: g-proteobacteria)]